MYWLSAIAILALLASPAAWADVVGAEATGCPNGSVGSVCHGGPYCAVQSCSASAPCPGGKVCQAAQLCVVQFDCDGRGGPHFVEAVRGSCGGPGTCNGGTCKVIDACVSTGCSCALVGARAGASAGLALLAAGLMLAWRIRARRPRRRC